MTVTREDIAAYADGELAPERALQVEEAVERDPSWRSNWPRIGAEGPVGRHFVSSPGKLCPNTSRQC